MAPTTTGTLDLPAEAEARKEPDGWDRCGRMEISVATSFTNDAPVTIDFSDTIGHGKGAPRREKRNDGNCYWLRPEWRENSEGFRARVILPFFIGAASEAGFRINGGWDPRFDNVYFRCIRGRRNDRRKNREATAKRRSKMKLKNPNAKPVPRNRGSKRPRKLDRAEGEDVGSEREATGADADVICKFNFRVYWDDVKLRWFIPRRQAGCRCHNGHPHNEHPHLCIQPRHAGRADKGLSPVELADSAEGGENAGTSVMGENGLVHHCSGYAKAPSQLTQQQQQARVGELVEAQGQDAKADFLPIFETICNLANAAGPEGRRVLEQELNALKDKQLAIIAKKKKPTSGKDAYSENMHLYESVCKYDNDAEEEE